MLVYLDETLISKLGATIGGGASSEQVDKNTKNIGVNSLELAILRNNGLYEQPDGFADAYSNQDGIDDGASIKAAYDAGNDLYQPSSKPLTGVGGVKHDTLAGWFNPAPILFNGTSDAITTPDSADWNLGANWTIELSTAVDTAVNGNRLLSYYKSSGNNRSWLVQTLDTGAISLLYSEDGISSTTVSTGAGVIVDETRQDILITRAGDNLAIFVDGVREATQDMTGVGSFYNADSNLAVGAFYDGSGLLAPQLTGSLENIRISNVSRTDPLIATCVVPTENFTDDSDTILLLLGNQPDESTVFFDSVNMTLLSEPYTAMQAPTSASMVALINLASGATINTDVTLEFSMDGGSTWTTLILEKDFDYDANVEGFTTDRTTLTGSIGTSIQYRFKTLDGKIHEFHAVDVKW